MKVKCKECGAENPEDAEYCLECGELFEKDGDTESFAGDLVLNYHFYRRVIFAILFLIGILVILGGIFTNNIGLIVAVIAFLLSIYSIHKFLTKKAGDSQTIIKGN